MAEEGEETESERERPEGERETVYFRRKGRGNNEVISEVGSSSRGRMRVF